MVSHSENGRDGDWARARHSGREIPFLHRTPRKSSSGRRVTVMYFPGTAERRHECLSIPRHRERFVPGTWYTVLRCGALTEGARRATGVSAPQRDEAAVMGPPGASAWEAGAAVAWLPQTDPLHRHGTRHATGGRRWVPGRLLRLPVHGRRTHKYWPIASGLPARLGALANQRSIPPP